ncbi:MAM and LDL-receptor class A domain-containing protein 1 [Nymphon striatum]|nr:MAM and LDL-receptor class A domain-containing protein 1 [Nymphon striatum]
MYPTSTLFPDDRSDLLLIMNANLFGFVICLDGYELRGLKAVTNSDIESGEIALPKGGTLHLTYSKGCSAAIILKISTKYTSLWSDLSGKTKNKVTAVIKIPQSTKKGGSKKILSSDWTSNKYKHRTISVNIPQVSKPFVVEIKFLNGLYGQYTEIDNVLLKRGPCKSGTTEAITRKKTTDGLVVENSPASIKSRTFHINRKGCLRVTYRKGVLAKVSVLIKTKKGISHAWKDYSSTVIIMKTVAIEVPASSYMIEILGIDVDSLSRNKLLSIKKVKFELKSCNPEIITSTQQSTHKTTHLMTTTKETTLAVTTTETPGVTTVTIPTSTTVTPNLKRMGFSGISCIAGQKGNITSAVIESTGRKRCFTMKSKHHGEDLAVRIFLKEGNTESMIYSSEENINGEIKLDIASSQDYQIIIMVKNTCIVQSVTLGDSSCPESAQRCIFEDNDDCKWEHGSMSHWRITEASGDESTIDHNPGLTTGGDCNFEHGFSTWSNSDVDPWVIITPKDQAQKSKFPPIDHTLKSPSGHYAYLSPQKLYVDSDRKSVSGTLLSILMQPIKKQLCMTFWILSPGTPAMNSLSVYKKYNSGANKILYHSSMSTFNWTEVNVHIGSSTKYYHVYITGSVNVTSNEGISIDDIDFTTQNCMHLFFLFVQFFSPCVF